MRRALDDRHLAIRSAQIARRRQRFGAVVETRCHDARLGAEDRDWQRRPQLACKRALRVAAGVEAGDDVSMHVADVDLAAGRRQARGKGAFGEGKSIRTGCVPGVEPRRDEGRERLDFRARVFKRVQARLAGEQAGCDDEDSAEKRRHGGDGEAQQRVAGKRFRAFRRNRAHALCRCVRVRDRIRHVCTCHGWPPRENCDPQPCAASLRITFS